MAAPTRSSAQQTKNTRVPMAKGKISPHLDALLMLGSQLLTSTTFSESLPALITRGVDTEQIWQQYELRNEHKLALPTCTRNAVRIQSGLLKRKKKFVDHKRKRFKDMSEETSKKDDDDDDDDDNSDNSGDDEQILNSIKKRLEEDPNDEDENDNFEDSADDADKDELDFDFEVDTEIAKGLSDDDEEVEKKNSSLKKRNNKISKNVPQRTTIVDDKFFKLADMEQFLESEDLKETKRAKQGDRGKVEESSEDDSESDEEINMFDNLDSDNDESSAAKYADFFDPPYEGTENKKSAVVRKVHKKSADEHETKSSIEEEEDEDEDEDNYGDDTEMNEEEDGSHTMSDGQSGGDVSADDESIAEEGDDGMRKKSVKKVSFTHDLLESDSEEETTSKEGSQKKNKSTFELKQEQLKQKAKEMEELSLQEASWELKGEASASKRPENSLLETVLDFQHTSRAVPVITDDTTKTLEDLIKQRIRDKAYDNVERKEKPKEDAFEFKKRIVLDQEKSKQSLGELYEQEFLKQQQQDDEEVKADPECLHIEKELTKLFHQLDALSNFRYTPMKPTAEMKVIVNTPAIMMEEVAPVATADSELLAPQEIYGRKKGDLKADDERTSTDKKRGRRQKKLEKRERKKAKEAREKVVKKLKPGLGNKYSKDKALKQLEQISKSDKSITMIKGEKQKLTSSTAFFTQLQEEVQTNVRAKKGSKEFKKQKLNASKLML